MSLRLHYAIRSDVGHVREINEDSAYAGPHLLAVADGMGGHAAGEVASSTVISALAELDREIDAQDLLERLVEAMQHANAQLRALAARDGSLDGMGTTVTALLASGDHLGVLHVGDSRCYLLRGGELHLITHDHTLVQDLVDQGRITLEQANTHPQRSLLMRALDGREVEPDLSIRQALLHDRYLLCSDGLSGVVSGETILEALLVDSPQDAVDRLVELALKGGGPDNITVVVADVVEDEGEDADTTALVAGAAAEKGSVPGAAAARIGPNPEGSDGDSAAARAARIGRRRSRSAGLSAQDFADDQPRGGRRFVFIGVTVVVVLVVIGAAGWAWVRNQYYVGVDNEQVAIFQGVDFAGLSSVHSRHGPLSEVPEAFQAEVRRGIPADSLEDAEKIIEERLLGSATRPSPSPTRSSSPSPSPTSPLGVPLPDANQALACATAAALDPGNPLDSCLSGSPPQSP